ncbi:hypothetical protein JNUCC0626_13695 [Lentzea sp. JNUCC 0626]|uniref:hypothetical protein n=1 Tax=Lentzea sp. JNUCC 0626 TaxID=3367513 RepID=UPI003748D9AA
MLCAISPVFSQELQEQMVDVSERRRGFDRRGLLPGLVVLAAGALFGWALPQLDEAVPMTDVVRPGERFTLGDGISIAPPTGWQVLDGVRTHEKGTLPEISSSKVSVTKSRISIRVEVGTFTGDVNGLMDRLVANRSGTALLPSFEERGPRGNVADAVIQAFTSDEGNGLVAAFVLFDDKGVSIEVRAADDAVFAGNNAEVTSMLGSLQAEPGK